MASRVIKNGWVLVLILLFISVAFANASLTRSGENSGSSTLIRETGITPTESNEIENSGSSLQRISEPEESESPASGNLKHIGSDMEDGSESEEPPQAMGGIRALSNGNGCLVLDNNANNYINEDTVICVDTYTNPYVILNASNIELDCNDSILDGSGIGNGIHVYNQNYTTIKNCQVQNYAIGIYIVSSSMFNNVTNNTVNSNNYGIRIASANSNNVFDNIVNSNSRGVRVDGSSSSNKVFSNFVNSNSVYGLEARSSTFDNIIYNNNLTNTYNTYDLGSNQWNTVQQTGPNMIGGQDIGGNYYSNYSGYDGNGDGIGETTYSIPGGSNYDYLPLTNYFMPPPNCTDSDGDGFNVTDGVCGPVDCDDNNATIRPILNNTYTKLTSDTMLCSDTYESAQIELDSSHITLDCNNSVLDEGGSGNGISVYGEDYTTIKNCFVTDYGIGIYLSSGSNFNTVQDNIVTGNNHGIRLVSNNNNLIYNNNVSNNNVNAYDSGTNNWNTVQQTGPNIIGGQDIGGNYYSDYTGLDTDNDGIGDSANYPIDGGLNYDYLPLTNMFVPPPNDPPTLSFVDLTPNNPLTSDDLNCSFLAIDNENSTFNASVTWYNGTENLNNWDEEFVVDNNTVTYVSTAPTSADTLAGETWYCEVTVWDLAGSDSMNDSELIQGLPDLENPAIYYNPDTDLDGTYAKDWILVNVTASDLNKDTVLLYWNGVPEAFANQNGDIYWTNKAGLADGTYTFYAWVNDTTGNENQTETREVILDTTPPETVTGLEDQFNSTDWIYWNWTNPGDSDFNHTQIWIDGFFYADVEAPLNYYNATGLSPDTLYEIGTRTVDQIGNVNTTWVNDTAWTQAVPIPNTAPIVNLIAPLNDTLTNDSTPTHVFNFTDSENSTASCTLYYNGAIKGANASTINDTNTDVIASTSSDGIYQWYVNCSDGEYESQSEVRVITIDTTAPVINSISDIPDPVLQGNVINITANVTDNLAGIDSVLFEVDGINQSPTGQDGDIYYYTGADTSVLGLHDYTVYANDTAGNEAVFQSGNYTVVNQMVYWNQSTLDLGAITGGNTANGNATIISNGTNSQTTITEDSDTCNCISFSPGGPFNLGDGAMEEIEFIASPVGLVNGTVYYAVYNLTSNQDSTPDQITISFMYLEPTANIPPVINLESPASGWTNNNATTHWFNVTDSDDLMSSCFLYYNDVLVGSNDSVQNGTSTELTPSEQSEGNYTWYVNCTDGTDTTQSEIRWIYIDVSEPNIVLEYPLDNNITDNNASKHSFNFTDTYSSTASCSLYYDGSFQGSNTSTLNDTSSLITATPEVNEGTWQWWINCTDLAGNEAKSLERILTIDVTQPVINWILDTPDPVYQNNVINITANITDNLGIAQVIFQVDSVDYSPTGQEGDVYYYDTADTSVLGLHDYTVFAQDLAGNWIAQDGNFTVQVMPADMPPMLSWVNLTPDSPLTTDNLNCSFLATDPDSATFLANVTWYNGTLNLNTWDELNMIVYNNTEMNVSTAPTSADTLAGETWYCVVTVWGVSGSDVMNDSELIQAVAPPARDTENPVINWILDTPDPVNQTYTINISASVTDNVSVDTVLFEIDGVNYTATGNIGDVYWFESADTSVLGVHNYTVYANDTSGNNATPMSGSYTVQLIIPPINSSPILNIISPANDTTTNNNTTEHVFNYTDLEDPVIECTLYYNGINISYNSSVINNTETILNSGEQAEGNYTWYIICSDGVNSVMSTPYTLTIDLDEGAPAPGPGLTVSGGGPRRKIIEAILEIHPGEGGTGGGIVTAPAVGVYSYPEVYIIAGDTIEVPVTIENLGDNTDTYNIQILGIDWATLSQSSITLGSGESREITLTLVPGTNVSGDFGLSIIVTSSTNVNSRGVYPILVHVSSTDVGGPTGFLTFTIGEMPVWALIIAVALAGIAAWMGISKETREVVKKRFGQIRKSVTTK